MLESIFSHLNILYIFMCNVVTYLIISCFKKDLHTGWKRVISTAVAAGIGLVCIYKFDYDREAIFTSFFAQFLMYDYVIKWFMNKVDASKLENKTE